MDSDVQRETKADCKKITHSRGKTQGEFDIIFSPATSNIAGPAVYTLTADKYMLLTILTQILLTRTWSFSIYEMKHTR